MEPKSRCGPSWPVPVASRLPFLPRSQLVLVAIERNVIDIEDAGVTRTLTAIFGPWAYRWHGPRIVVFRLHESRFWAPSFRRSARYKSSIGFRKWLCSSCVVRHACYRGCSRVERLKWSLRALQQDVVAAGRAEEYAPRILRPTTPTSGSACGRAVGA